MEDFDPLFYELNEPYDGTQYCYQCGEELLFEEEVEQGVCFDCDSGEYQGGEG